MNERVKMKHPQAETSPRLHKLIDSLDCLTEDDLLLIAEVTPLTIETWRKRGEGPGYVRLGKRVLYPRAGVVDWIAARVRDRKHLGQGLL